MAVEKMDMLNLVAPMTKIDEVIRKIVTFGDIHIVNAMVEIDESKFTLSVNEENLDEIADMGLIGSYREEKSLKNMEYKTQKLMDFFDVKERVEEQHAYKDYDFNETEKRINIIEAEVGLIEKKMGNLKFELEELQNFDDHIKYISDLDIDIGHLNKMACFDYKVGVLTKEGRQKIKNNYENIPAIVLHIGTAYDGEVYLIILVKEMETETNRILRSLNFKELHMPRDIQGSPKIVKKETDLHIAAIKEDLKNLDNQAAKLKEKYLGEIQIAYSQFRMEEAVNSVKSEVAYTDNFFYLSGWVPQKEQKLLDDVLKSHEEDVILVFKEPQNVYQYIKPPTKLRNNWLMKPFEALIKMYGTPAYNEIDPTILLSITYMFLFGAMFGDIGQGLFICFMGLVAKKKMSSPYIGQIFIRLGISSTIFGFLYGSVFGFEEILPALLIRPMENINSMLAGSIIVGAIFLCISFIFGLINASKRKDLKEGVFGRNGVAGFLFFLGLLILLANQLLGRIFVPNNICMTIMGICLILIVVREPLTHLILGQRPLYEESAGSYYTESIFEGIETIISTLSNTISFIRVGAFALNHVGLFMAFHTMAEIANNATASVFIYILGNVIVIGLEGLIVFIQALRLEYYEMFSKYFVGEGIEFEPVGLKHKNVQ